MRRGWMMAVVATGLAMSAVAQLLPALGGGGLGAPLGGVTGGLLGQPGSQSTVLGGVQGGLDFVGGVARDLNPTDLLSLRRQRLRELVKDNRPALDMDDDGNPIRRDEIVATAPSDAALAAAKAAGFTVLRRETVEGLDLPLVVLAPPKGVPARKAIERLSQGDYALNHIYEPAYAALEPGGGKAAEGRAGGALMGLIDGGVGAHPAFAGAAIEQRGFAGAVKPSGHGTAVASLMVGQAGAFRGVLPGGRLLAADIYGGSEANGSAEAIARALGWLTVRGVKVVNMSLVGPPNPLLAAAVKAAQAKGVLIVAAVGNDGPAAPPQYPASYPGVISVTGVDAKGRALIEAGRPTHLDFAAPGADMAGAVPGGRWEALRGTSFAAPLVAASLAKLDRGDAVAVLAGEAKPGRKVGRGIVCGDCATPPKAVGIK
ncbi:S8 family serine peptidase [Sphingomonas oryzagri]|uniref:S8 family serine peptidase n=1 Tax=Sphingomonas oryzagri TaxID=3042314 RepID=A0ABT6N0R5_9SPHN|nr:S8 family serine peptidase [Sphingomonas oryzagri]MDH7638787.1 S8 family serine peptidase [Sphingomonas oryzagri]